MSDRFRAPKVPMRGCKIIVRASERRAENHSTLRREINPAQRAQRETKRKVTESVNSIK